MSDFNWCHGPKCHTKHTQDRIRGVKGSKVLRTRKIKQNRWNANNEYAHFCSTSCWDDFAFAHWDELIRLHPRNEALETPIHNPEKVRPYEGASWTTTEIKVDETRQS